MKIPALPGNYVIAARAPADISLRMKTLGSIQLPAGFYLYCGSAHGPGGLEKRIGRHLNSHTKKFWHFDFIKEYLEIFQVWWQVDRANLECATAQFLFTMADTHCPVRGFGASDCRKGCPAHLIRFQDLSAVENAFSALNQNGWQYQQLVLPCY